MLYTVENYRKRYTLLQCFLLQDAVIQRRVLQGGKLSLVILWKSYLVNSELYLAIAQAFISRERERGRNPLLALLERDREDSCQFLIRH
jgi:hypothetical protein